jgi:hypothetical protein
MFRRLIFVDSNSDGSNSGSQRMNYRVMITSRRLSFARKKR